MSMFHHIKIVTDERGHRSRVEIDGREVQGVVEVNVSVSAMNHPRVTIDLVPRFLEVEGAAEIDMHREILPIPRREDSSEVIA